MKNKPYKRRVRERATKSGFLENRLKEVSFGLQGGKGTLVETEPSIGPSNMNFVSFCRFSVSLVLMASFPR